MDGRTTVIWLVLIVFGLLALGAMAVPRGVRRPGQLGAWLASFGRQKQAAAERRLGQAQEAARYASEIAVAVAGAAATAERRRAECRRAQEKVERAWRAHRAADAALDRQRRAAAYGPATDAATDEERAQALRRAAKAAYRRGDLSDTQLLDALTGRNGWNPRLHPAEQELVLARAAVRHRFAEYQAALDDEDECWRAADIATAAVRSLRREAGSAGAQAEAAFRALPSMRPATA